MDMKGKVAIVTGGGRDIGRASVMALAEAGARVAINYHSSAETAQSAVAEIEAAGGEAFALQGDMTKADDAKALVAAAVDRWGAGVDALVHVTGGLVARKKLPEITPEHWQTVMDLNLTSLLYAVQAALPHMNEGGSITALASQAGRDGGGGGAIAYGASKGAVMTMTRGMAKELGPKLRVNAVCPGMIDTDFHNTFTPDEVRKMVAGNTPLKREGSSQDVGNLVCYLASDRAAFITGACVDINGGTLFS
jgi:3-oxoacyl-[acyl-carrier protein] reductase